MGFRRMIQYITKSEIEWAENIFFFLLKEKLEEI